MCPGGVVVPAASEEGRVVTNGMSYYARDRENANSALLVGVGPEDFGSDHPLSGMYWQRRLEENAFRAGGGTYAAPAQRVEDLLKGRPSVKGGEVVPSYARGVVWGDLNMFCRRLSRKRCACRLRKWIGNCMVSTFPMR